MLLPLPYPGETLMLWLPGCTPGNPGVEGDSEKCQLVSMPHKRTPMTICREVQSYSALADARQPRGQAQRLKMGSKWGQQKDVSYDQVHALMISREIGKHPITHN